MIMPTWRDAPGRRRAYFADVAGRRLFVEQTVRSHRAHGIVGSEYQTSVDGVRLGEFNTLGDAENAALDAVETKTPPRREPQGRVGVAFDY